MIRLYGHMKGSFRTVTEGLQLAFEKLGVLEGTHLGENVELEDGIGGSGAPIAVVVGDPMRVLQAHYQGSHKEVWLMLAPNSEGIPPVVRQELSGPIRHPSRGKVPAVTGFLAPSSWAEKVLRRQFPDHPVILCRHGVLPEFRMDPELREKASGLWEIGQFRILHVTSSRLSRKCTRELISAWKEIHPKYPKSKMEVLINPEFVEEFKDYLRRADARESVNIVAGQNYELSLFARSMQLYSFVVQPSRAEGFGLVPLESRACGIPVVATNCTGHQDHMKGPGIVYVEHGIQGRSDDYPGATAPTVTKNAIGQSLRRMLNNWKHYDAEARGAASEVQEAWTWESQTAPAVQKLKERL